jgi:hypothetical protein
LLRGSVSDRHQLHFVLHTGVGKKPKLKIDHGVVAIVGERCEFRDRLLKALHVFALVGGR